MEKLQQLFSLCQGEVILTHNGHKACYESVEDYVTGWGNGDEREDIPDAVFAEMVKRDTVIELQYYPNSPVGFNLIFHYDLESAVDLALVGWTTDPVADPSDIAANAL